MKAILTTVIILLIATIAFLLFRGNQSDIKANVNTQIIAADTVQAAEAYERLLPENLSELAATTNTEWQEKLTQSQYRMLREKGTEIPYTSDLNEEDRPGTYVSADCGIPVFRSEQKFDSGTGWPSFYAPITVDAVELKADNSLGLSRTEVVDSVCDSHLGHVFNDAPDTPTGLRYCLNGVALKFVPDEV